VGLTRPKPKPRMTRQVTKEEVVAVPGPPLQAKGEEEEASSSLPPIPPPKNRVRPS